MHSWMLVTCECGFVGDGDEVFEQGHNKKRVHKATDIRAAE